MRVLKLTLPTRLLDLTNRQLISISAMWESGYPETEYLVKSFLILSGIKLDPVSGRFHHRSIRGSFVIDTDLLAQMCNKCTFLLTPDEIYPIPSIGLSRARHYRLYNATFEEYLMAENYYFAYTETKKEEHLDHLIACLYRKPWQTWDAAKIQLRARAYRKLNPALKNVVFLWYVGFRTYVPKRCKALFSAKGSGTGKPFNPRDYINGMIHQLSNGDITIKDKLLSRPCWDALDELEQRALENQTLIQSK
ncbi:MAG: hypothetical protein ACOYMF_05570 [Bacteroidales bacterium]